MNKLRFKHSVSKKVNGWKTVLDFLAPRRNTSLLVAFEMIAAMLCYIPVARLADECGRRPVVLVTFVFFTLFPVTLLWANTFGWLTPPGAELTPEGECA